MSAVTVWSLVVAASGFLNVVGFIVGPILALIALGRFRLARDAGVHLRGRRLAIAALCISIVAVVLGVAAILAMLIVAYARLPSPPTQPRFHLF